MLLLSTAAKVEANKLHGDGAWIILLEINFSMLSEIIYICRNTEDVTWGGHTWVAFPFELDDIKETSDGEIPAVTLKVSNVTRAIQGYLEESNGGIGAVVTLRVVHSDHLDLVEPELEEVFTCVSTKVDKDWVSFELGSGDPAMKRFPPRRYLKNSCPFRFKGIECAYTGSETSCNRTLARCRTLGNSARYGGYPSIPQGGIYA